MSTNKAKELLWPTDSNILLRFAFLYVGQGSSTIVLARDGSSYKTLLIDINLDPENGGVNVPLLMSDLLEGKKLDVFVNTHPHDDHLGGVVELSEKVKIGEVWHSGHKPGKKYDDAYKNLQKVIKTAKDGGEIQLKGSREEKVIGEAMYYVLAPAEYVVDEVADEDPDNRYRRIHEQCAVIRFGTKDKWVLIPGDADRDAFEKHITEYHKERLGSVVLAASHHGSRSSFKHEKEDDPYTEGLNAINPEYVVISARKRDDSKDDPPHGDAIDLYREKVGENAVLHTGELGYSFICDIYDDGRYSGIRNDKGELAENYPIKPRNRITIVPPPASRSRVDDRPMGVT